MKKDTENKAEATIPVIRRNEIPNIIIDHYEVMSRRDGFIMLVGIQYIPEIGFVEQSRQIMAVQQAEELVSSIDDALDAINKDGKGK